MDVVKAIGLLVSSPGLFFKKARAKLRTSLGSTPKCLVLGSVGGVKFEFDFHFDPAIKLMYYEGYEIETVEAMRQCLNEGDTFIDVGANIGYLTAVGMSLVAKQGQVHSFEPVPRYYHRLRHMIAVNPDHSLTVNDFALGEEEREAEIAVTRKANIGWNTMVTDMMRESTVGSKVPVQVRRLDDYIEEKQLDRISLVKIDVEGYEFPVLKGMRKYLEDDRHRPAMICEIAPQAYALLGSSLKELEAYLDEFGYQARSLVNHRRKVRLSRLKKTTTVMLLPSAGA